MFIHSFIYNEVWSFRSIFEISLLIFMIIQLSLPLILFGAWMLKSDFNLYITTDLEYSNGCALWHGDKLCHIVTENRTIPERDFDIRSHFFSPRLWRWDKTAQGMGGGSGGGVILYWINSPVSRKISVNRNFWKIKSCLSINRYLLSISFFAWHCYKYYVKYKNICQTNRGPISCYRNRTN